MPGRSTVRSWTRSSISSRSGRHAPRSARVVKRTPVITSVALSGVASSGRADRGDVVLKAENLQRTGSFKIRGAMNKVASLGSGAARGVTTGSAGNHAQALAFAARALRRALRDRRPGRRADQQDRGVPQLRRDRHRTRRGTEGGRGAVDGAGPRARDHVLPAVRRRRRDRRPGHDRPRVGRRHRIAVVRRRAARRRRAGIRRRHRRQVAAPARACGRCAGARRARRTAAVRWPTDRC